MSTASQFVFVAVLSTSITTFHQHCVRVPFCRRAPATVGCGSRTPTTRSFACTLWLEGTATDVVDLRALAPRADTRGVIARSPDVKNGCGLSPSGQLTRILRTTVLVCISIPVCLLGVPHACESRCAPPQFIQTLTTTVSFSNTSGFAVWFRGVCLYNGFATPRPRLGACWVFRP